jgi:hypothetical protein
MSTVPLSRLPTCLLTGLPACLQVSAEVERLHRENHKLARW